VRRLVDNEVAMITSNLTLDEIWYVFIRISLSERFGKNWRAKLKKEPEILDKVMPILKRVTTDLLMIQNLIIVEISTSSVLKALDFMEEYRLLPRDAIHLAAMNAVGIKNVVTTDTDFCRVEGIDIYTCNPKALTKTDSGERKREEKEKEKSE
jgi:predicted nucleic acid-binding protein